MSSDNILVGLDVGTSKTCLLIAEVSHDEQIEVIGAGVVPTRGMRKGVVVNPDEVVESIEAALKKAEQQSGFKIVSAFVGISGAHIATQSSQGVIAVRQPDRQITPDDVQRAIDAARAAGLPGDREIVHVLPRHFVVDGEDGIRSPVGMLGHRIEVQTTIVSGAMTSVNNVLRCVERAGLGIDSLVLQSMAAGEAVLTEAERDLGVVLIDIGGGTTDVGVFDGGALVHGFVLPVGGYQVTNDLSVGLRVPYAEAEDVKVHYGCALPELVEDARPVDLATYDAADSQPVTEADVAEIIAARMEELFELVQGQLKRAGYSSLPAGVVLTGGTAELRGLRRLAAEMFHTPVRVGSPSGLYGLADQVSTPAFASSVGLLRWGLLDQDEAAAGGVGGALQRLPALAGIGSAISSWLRNFLP
jgi:cell division protein FtsA